MSGTPPLVDIHNHLVPGVDDGARDVDDALEALAAMHEQGVRRVVTTPHLDAGLLARPDAADRKLAEMDVAWGTLLAAASLRFPDVDLRRGHEIMLDVPSITVTDPRLRLGGGSAVLVEFPRMFVPSGSTEVLYNLRVAGWLPLVAHPERYVNVDAGNLDLVEDWRRVGASMAVNAGSLLGGFGATAQRSARELLARGWVDLLGSDYHARGGRRPLVLRDTWSLLVESGGEAQARLLLSHNPGRLMDGEQPDEVEPLRLDGGLRGLVRRILRR